MDCHEALHRTHRLAHIGSHARTIGGDRVAIDGVPEQVAAPASTAPSTFSAEFDAKKKKCTYLCVQSTLPTVEKDTYFVNGNRHLISMNTFSFTRRNLDTRKVTNRADYPAGIALTGSAVSRDGSTLVIAGTNENVDFGNLHFSTVDTETFELTELTTDPRRLIR